MHARAYIYIYIATSFFASVYLFAFNSRSGRMAAAFLRAVFPDDPWGGSSQAVSETCRAPQELVG